MPPDMSIKDGTCCSPSFQGLRKLTLPNGAQVGVMGLDAVMEELFVEGKAADETIAAEIIQRLSKQNYISPSARNTYEELLLREYRVFYEKKSALKAAQIEKENEPMTNQENNQNTRKKGLFGLFKGEKKATENSCCNMKIVPKEQPVKESKGSCCNMKIVPKEQAVAENSDKKGNCDCGKC
jgi:hypothetical protein